MPEGKAMSDIEAAIDNDARDTTPTRDNTGDKPGTFDSVADAVAELDRRDAARKAERKAAREAAKPEPEEVDEPKAEKALKRPDDDAEDDDEPRKKEQAEEVEEADDDEDDIDAKEEAGEDDDEPEAKEEKKPEPPAKVRIKLDDQEVEATPDEVSNYVKEAKQAREQAAQARTQLQQQAQMLAQQGQALAQMAREIVGQEPDISLAQTDPGRYVAERALFQQRMQTFQHLTGQTQQASQIAQQNAQQARAESIAKERAALLKAMPELADPQKQASFGGRVAKVAQKYGISPQELSEAFDHRSYLMFRDLARLADMDAERTKVRDKLTGKPPVKSPEQRASKGQAAVSEASSRKAKSDFLKSERSMRDVRNYLSRTAR